MKIKEFEGKKPASNQVKNQGIWLTQVRKLPVCYRFILKYYVHTGIWWEKDGSTTTVLCNNIKDCLKQEINRKNYRGIFKKKIIREQSANFGLVESLGTPSTVWPTVNVCLPILGCLGQFVLWLLLVDIHAEHEAAATQLGLGLL